jgi:hypothetical protein
MTEQQLRQLVREELLRERYDLPDDRPMDPKREIIDSVGSLEFVETSTARGNIRFTIKDRWYMKVTDIVDTGTGYRVSVEISDFGGGGSQPSDYDFTATSFANLKSRLVDLALSYGARQRSL